MIAWLLNFQIFEYDVKIRVQNLEIRVRKAKGMPRKERFGVKGSGRGLDRK